MSNFTTSVQNTFEFLDREFATIRTGRAMPSLLDSVMVEAWGSSVPLNNVATVTAVDATLLVVKPFDKGTLKDVEKAIIESNLGYNPSISDDIIRVPIPTLTQETREKFVKKAKEVAEEAKISIRKARTEEKQNIEKNLKEKLLTEDQAESEEKKLQDEVDKANAKVDEMLKAKEEVLMKV